jgi:hypothetical protein
VTDGQHLHLDDYPETLRLLSALVGARSDNERLGYRATEHGAFVDWEHMIAGPLSSTEVAVAHIARGCAILERAGGLPPRLAGVVAEVVGAVA